MAKLEMVQSQTHLDGLVANAQTQIDAHLEHLSRLRSNLEVLRGRAPVSAFHCMDMITHRHQEQQLAGEVRRFETLLRERQGELELYRLALAGLRQHADRPR